MPGTGMIRGGYVREWAICGTGVEHLECAVREAEAEENAFHEANGEAILGNRGTMARELGWRGTLSDIHTLLWFG